MLDMVAEIMGGAPRIADWLSRNPSLLDAVLTGDFMEPLGPREELAGELEAMLAEANDYEDVLELTRRWTNDQKFRVGVQILRGVVGGAAAGESLTAVADTVLSALLPRVEAEFARRHGRFPAVDWRSWRSASWAAGNCRRHRTWTWCSSMTMPRTPRRRTAKNPGPRRLVRPAVPAADQRHNGANRGRQPL